MPTDSAPVTSHSALSTPPPKPKHINPTPEWLKRRIKQLGPWHMNIQITEQLNTGQVFSDDGAILERPANEGISLLKLRDRFIGLLDKMYPDGLAGKRFLDCACNAGGYCYWARERGATSAFGFDVREHWIRQARFVKNQRKVGPTDNIQLKVMDLYDLPSTKMAPFDITNFKGIFYHLPDPVTGLKVAADMTREVLIFNTSTMWGEKDGYMKTGMESRENLMSGVHGLKWYPTGPKVCADILKWLGFEEVKLMFFRQQYDQAQLGRLEIIAAREPGMLENIGGELL